MLKPIEVLKTEAERQGWSEDRLRIALDRLSHELSHPFADPNVDQVYAHGAELLRVYVTDLARVQSYSGHHLRWITHTHFAATEAGRDFAAREAMDWYPRPEPKALLGKWGRVLQSNGAPGLSGAEQQAFWFDVKNPWTSGQANPFLLTSEFAVADGAIRGVSPLRPFQKFMNKVKSLLSEMPEGTVAKLPHGFGATLEHNEVVGLYLNERDQKDPGAAPFSFDDSAWEADVVNDIEQWLKSPVFVDTAGRPVKKEIPANELKRRPSLEQPAPSNDFEPGF